MLSAFRICSTFALCITASLLTACSSVDVPKANDSTNRIAVCSNGVKVKLSGELEAKLFSLVEAGVTASGSVESEVKGQFLSEANVSEERAVKLYEFYVKCIQGERSTSELLSIEESNYKNTVKSLRDNDLTELAEELDNDYTLYVDAIKKGQRVLESKANVRFKRTLLKAKTEMNRLNAKSDKTDLKDEFVFKSLKIKIKQPKLFFNGTLTLTALDKRKRSHSCYIRIKSFVDGQEKPPEDFQLQLGKPKLYTLGDKRYLIHVIDNSSDDECTLSSYKA